MCRLPLTCKTLLPRCSPAATTAFVPAAQALGSNQQDLLVNLPTLTALRLSRPHLLAYFRVSNPSGLYATLALKLITYSGLGPSHNPSRNAITRIDRGSAQLIGIRNIPINIVVVYIVIHRFTDQVKHVVYPSSETSFRAKSRESRESE